MIKKLIGADALHESLSHSSPQKFFLVMLFYGFKLHRLAWFTKQAMSTCGFWGGNFYCWTISTTGLGGAHFVLKGEFSLDFI